MAAAIFFLLLFKESDTEEPARKASLVETGKGKIQRGSPRSRSVLAYAELCVRNNSQSKSSSSPCVKSHRLGSESSSNVQPTAEKKREREK